MKSFNVGTKMVRVFRVAIAGTAFTLTAVAALAQGPSHDWRESGGNDTLNKEKAAFIVAPFYDALNRPAIKNLRKLLTETTAVDYVSCSGNTPTPVSIATLS